MHTHTHMLCTRAFGHAHTHMPCTHTLFWRAHNPVVTYMACPLDQLTRLIRKAFQTDTYQAPPSQRACYNIACVSVPIPHASVCAPAWKRVVCACMYVYERVRWSALLCTAAPRAHAMISGLAAGTPQAHGQLPRQPPSPSLLHHPPTLLSPSPQLTQLMTPSMPWCPCARSHHMLQARLQSSMLDQIASFRSQLEVVAEENKQLRHELTLLNQAAAIRVRVRACRPQREASRSACQNCTQARAPHAPTPPSNLPFAACRRQLALAGLSDQCRTECLHERSHLFWPELACLPACLPVAPPGAGAPQ